MPGFVELYFHPTEQNVRHTATVHVLDGKQRQIEAVANKPYVGRGERRVWLDPYGKPTKFIVSDPLEKKEVRIMLPSITQYETCVEEPGAAVMMELPDKQVFIEPGKTLNSLNGVFPDIMNVAS